MPRRWDTSHRGGTKRLGVLADYPGTMGDDAGLSVDARLRELRQRADEDFLAPPSVHEAGRHQLDLEELGLRVSLTRSRYPNRPDGVDQYAITISQQPPEHPPEEAQTRRVLAAAFGEAANAAVERPGGPAVRMFRVPAGEHGLTDPGGPVMSSTGLPQPSPKPERH